MKKLGFILLMMLLPLQSGWAVVHLYHSHDSNNSLVDVVFHDHLDSSYNHHHGQGEHAHEPGSSTNQADHHHHFHLHTFTVFNEVNIPDLPSPSAVQYSRTPPWQQILFSQQIERPNWR